MVIVICSSIISFAVGFAVCYTFLKKKNYKRETIDIKQLFDKQKERRRCG